MKRISVFAIMACLASSLTFAGAQTQSTSSADEAKAKAAQSSLRENAQRDSVSSRETMKNKDDKNNKNNKKKDKHNAKPAPSNQEREFERVLMGIYG